MSANSKEYNRAYYAKNKERIEENRIKRKQRKQYVHDYKPPVDKSTGRQKVTSNQKQSLDRFLAWERGEQKHLWYDKYKNKDR